MKYLALLVLIFVIGGCIVTSVIISEQKKTHNLNINRQFQDTPLYYKRYMETSLIYKSKHKH